MADEELDAAIDRILREPGDNGVIPPPEARQLDPCGRDLLIQFSRGDARTGRVRNELMHAAHGMAGGNPIVPERLSSATRLTPIRSI